MLSGTVSAQMSALTVHIFSGIPGPGGNAIIAVINPSMPVSHRTQIPQTPHRVQDDATSAGRTRPAYRGTPFPPAAITPLAPLRFPLCPAAVRVRALVFANNTGAGQAKPSRGKPALFEHGGCTHIAGAGRGATHTAPTSNSFYLTSSTTYLTSSTT